MDHAFGACMLSCSSQVRLFVTLWTIACQAPLSMRFSRQEYWSGLPCPPPEDLPNPVTEPGASHIFCIAGGLFTAEPLGKPMPSVLYLKSHQTEGHKDFLLRYLLEVL